MLFSASGLFVWMRSNAFFRSLGAAVASFCTTHSPGIFRVGLDITVLSVSSRYYMAFAQSFRALLSSPRPAAAAPFSASYSNFAMLD
jgi:hypothetical protein